MLAKEETRIKDERKAPEARMGGKVCVNGCWCGLFSGCRNRLFMHAGRRLQGQN